MRIGRIESKAISFCLVVAIFATYSMVALAGESRVVGEIVVSGSSIDGSSPVVLVNGEEVKSGRSIFTSSTIVTKKESSATVSIGSLGTLRIAPNSSLTLSFDDKGIRTVLKKGTVSVLNAADKVAVALPNGTISMLTAGKAVSASPQDDDKDNGKKDWVLWALIAGGAAAAIIFAASRNGNRVNLGGGTAVVSPNF